LCSFEHAAGGGSRAADPHDRRSPGGGASAARLTRVCSGFTFGWVDDRCVDRHWTHLLVALSGVLAGAVIFAAGDAGGLAAGVAAVSAVAALLPEAASGRRSSPR